MTADAGLELRRARVAAIRDVAVDIRAFDLVPADGRPFAACEAGAHVDVHVPAGVLRQYSLCGETAASDRYRIAVKKEPGGRGGSLSMHTDVEVDSIVAISPPRNFFPLVQDTSPSLLIAGGIGITPIYSMVKALDAAGRTWTLHYCARSQAHAAFWRELQALAPERVTAHFSEVPVLDVASVLATRPPGAHVYCCGPVGLMSAVKAAATPQDEAFLHFEWFAAPAVDHTHDETFEVHLERSGVTLTVSADKSILQVVRENGIDVASACEEGVCGTCETRVIAGEPEHRDMLLTEAERNLNRSMMICISRAKSKRLVLDL